MKIILRKIKANPGRPPSTNSEKKSIIPNICIQKLRQIPPAKTKRRNFCFY